jgi:hypothetical protein
MLINDQALSNFAADALTIFGVRPPELRCIRHVSKYYQWFFRAKK